MMRSRTVPLTCLTIFLIACSACSDSSSEDPFGRDDAEGSGTGISVEDDGSGDAGTTNGSSGSEGTSVECTNVRPTGTMWDEATCDQWASETPECDQPWMVDNNYCNESCGRCTPGASTGSSSSGNSDVTGEPLEVNKFVGNITTQNQANTGGFNFATHWDQLTPENAGKWGSVQQSGSSGYNWNTLDALYDYAEDNGIIFKQHAFVWGSQQPGGSISEQNVRDWISAFCERYPNTKLIDVVNEPPPHTEPSYSGAIGGGTNGDWQWITNSFIWARESCPGAILILNDYNNIEWADQNQHFIDITNTVLENGGPIDAVGAQAHDLDHMSLTTTEMKRLVQKLHDDTGLDVYITEYDPSTSDDNRQLAFYQDHIPYFLETDFIKGVTIWGWIYGQTWSQAPESGLIRNGNPRAAMTWLMQTLDRPEP